MENPFSLLGKNIIITGASKGIGKKCAVTCSRMGANIVLIARNEEILKETFNDLAPGNHFFFSRDITQFEQLENIINESVMQLGKISGFIHSAGMEATSPLQTLTAGKYEQIMSVNVIAAFEMARILSKKKYHDESGASYVFISSVMGLLGQSGKTAYCSSKGALLAGARAMALELAAKKIRVNCVLPAVVQTEMSEKLFEGIPDEARHEILAMHPLGLGTPEDVAHACLFLLSDASRWITGTNLIVDGGYSAR
jgi:NAD(P)-dependent dehydrogenase (short-subunit alcohol dehydrogenase family)